MAGNQSIRTEAQPRNAQPEDPAERILDVIRQLSAELHPGRRVDLTRGLHSRFDDDLGFDSLARAELLLRVERALKVQLPESLLAKLETPMDLLQAALDAAPRTGQSISEVRVPPLEAGVGVPDQAATLIEVLDWHAQTQPDRRHITLSHGTTDDEAITYRQLAERAREVANGLRRWGLQPGERAAIMLPTSDEFFFAFFGILYAGGVPVPIYPPMRLSQVEDHLRRQAVILNNAGAAILITVPEALRLAQLMKTQIDSLRGVETASALRTSSEEPLPAIEDPTQPALFQYTSGSTGDPKGVVLSHVNLLANIRAMGERLEADSSDVFVSWLPLYHDMGLIGAWLATMYFAVPTVIMSPLTFLARPESWLWAIHRHRGTLTAGPNFAFELCINKVADKDIEGLDLSSLRLIANGAEPISASTIRRFTQRFKNFGLRAEAIAPVYGLAESSVGLAFPPPGRPPIIDRIQRAPLAARGEAVPAADDDETALECVACGRPLPGHEIRVVDETGRELGERHEGRLQFRGPSSTSGYYANPEKNRALFDGDWLETGDLSYIASGDVFFTGRIKDIIIRAGRNIYPTEIESAVGNIDDIRKGCVAVFGSADPRTGTERIVVLAETRETDPGRQQNLEAKIVEVCTGLLDGAPDDVILAPPHTVPKTSSGKIRRSATREIYENGNIGVRPQALWRQMVRLGLSGLLPQGRRMLRTTRAVIYAGWWWLAVILTASWVWPAVVFSPSRKTAWRVLRGAARSLFRLTGIAVRVEGLENWTSGAGIVVINHTSYVDGLALAAALPGKLRFVAKKELETQRIAGIFLRRLGTCFVERFEMGEAAESKTPLVAAARRGDRLAFFPEGTLHRTPGLMAFHLGAFLVATESGLPVTPVALRGARSVLRGDQWFPRRGGISISIAPAIAPAGEGWEAAIKLRDTTRREVLARCGEPDLAREKITF